MRRTLAAFAMLVGLSTPAAAQYEPLYDWGSQSQSSGSLDKYVDRARERTRDHENWINQQQTLQQRRNEERRSEWNRWQDNMRSDDMRQQPWDSQPGWEW